MAVQNDNTLVTKGDLKNLYADKIAPYLGANMQLSVGVKDYYSTDEKIIGVWMGKPLYQKCFKLSSLSGGDVQFSAGITSLDTLVDFRVLAYSDSYTLYEVMGGNSYWDSIAYYHVNTDKIHLGVSSSYFGSGSFAVVIMQYTKSTDTANSAATTVGCYDINFPNNWLENTEIYFGNGLYGKRFTGTITKSANEFSMLNLDSSGVTKLINCGGSWYHGSEYMCLNGTNDVYQSSGLVLSNGILSLRTKSNQARTNAPYDIWALYTK